MIRTMNTPSNVLLYSAVGDALGMPFEQPRDEVHPDLASWDGSMVPGVGYLKLPAGTYTDDTEFSLALAESLIRMRGFVGADVMPGYATAGDAAGIGCGGTLRRAIKNFRATQDVTTCGLTEAPYVGSGTAMRAAPLGVMFRTSSIATLREICALDAGLTHNMTEAKWASFVVARTVQLLLAGLSVRSTLDALYREDTFMEGWLREDAEYVRDTLDVGGFVRDGQARSIVTTALAFLKAYPRNPTEGLIAAVKYGGDTDTRAAVLGAFYGAMPDCPPMRADWLKTLKDSAALRMADRELLTTYPFVGYTATCLLTQAPPCL